MTRLLVLALALLLAAVPAFAQGAGVVDVDGKDSYVLSMAFFYL